MANNKNNETILMVIPVGRMPHFVANSAEEIFLVDPV